MVISKHIFELSAIMKYFIEAFLRNHFQKKKKKKDGHFDISH